MILQPMNIEIKLYVVCMWDPLYYIWGGWAQKQQALEMVWDPSWGVQAEVLQIYLPCLACLIH
jgi:hypothetical protein